MTPDSARRFIRDVIRGMGHRAGRYYRGAKGDIKLPNGSSSISVEKRKYGDTWVYFFGIQKGVDLIRQDRWVERDFDRMEETSHGTADYMWQDHYDEFGSGPYGRGLLVGRRLAVYEDRNFTFIEDVSVEDEETEYNFTFTQ